MKAILLSIVTVAAFAAHVDSTPTQAKPKVTKLSCGGIIGRGGKYGEPIDPGFDMSNNSSVDLDISTKRFSGSVQFKGTPKYVIAFKGYSFTVDADVQNFSVQSELIRKEDGKPDVIVGVGSSMNFDSTSTKRTVGETSITSLEGPNLILSAGKDATMTLRDGFTSGLIPEGTADSVSAYCVMYTTNDKAE